MRYLGNRNSKTAFTLAELLIVVAIIGVLVGISIPIFSSQMEKSREATDMANLRSAKGFAYAALMDGSFQTSTKQTSGYIYKCDTDYWYDVNTGTIIGEVGSNGVYSSKKVDSPYGQGTTATYSGSVYSAKRNNDYSVTANNVYGYNSTTDYTNCAIAICYTSPESGNNGTKVGLHIYFKTYTGSSNTTQDSKVDDWTNSSGISVS